MGDTSRQLTAVRRNGAAEVEVIEPEPVAPGGGAFGALHAEYHTTGLDIFEQGSPGANPGMAPKPGLLLVEYLPSRMADPALARRMKELEDQLKEARAAGIDSNEAALSDMEGYNKAIADFLCKILWSMSVHLPPYPAPPGTKPRYTVYRMDSGTLTPELLQGEVGAVLMGEIMLSVQEANAEKKGSKSNTTTGSLTTPLNRTERRRQKSSGSTSG